MSPSDSRDRIMSALRDLGGLTGDMIIVWLFSRIARDPDGTLRMVREWMSEILPELLVANNEKDTQAALENRIKSAIKILQEGGSGGGQ